MFTIRCGVNVPQSVTADNLYAAVLVADALAVKGWLGVQVIGLDGTTVPWRTLTAVRP
jgi:hypothetical protein